MRESSGNKNIVLSVVVPCFNEEHTLEECIARLLAVESPSVSLEIIIVDDASTDRSAEIATALVNRSSRIKLFTHERNSGKGAALRTGFKKATGDFVAVQDADLEYNPQELLRLIEPLRNGDADVVFGSRFAVYGAHRVLYFWHSLVNAFLTFVSNMFTDLNITDMETCYKVFRRDVIQAIDIQENRFGVEPEIVAKVAHMRLRIYEMGISYYGRTYEEGKKIGAKDGFRALYAILRYSAYRAPVPMQFILYVFIGGLAALANLVIFMFLFNAGMGTDISAPVAFVAAAAINYYLCILILFRHNARWGTASEILIYLLVVCGVGVIDLLITKSLIQASVEPMEAKVGATLIGLLVNFLGRRYFVFPEAASGPWQAQIKRTKREV
jgi:glycosyltransferase involved in cell wall biosynthesis